MDGTTAALGELDGGKFCDPDRTATGERRAAVDFRGLRTLWFNTGTLCNLTCDHCYIESSPRNDRLAYLDADDVAVYLDEIAAQGWDTEEIGFTGGEPFMNPDIIAMLDLALVRGFRVLVLSNAMKPMLKVAEGLLDLRQRHGRRLVIRVSLDHYSPALHEAERGDHAWRRTVDGLAWLTRNDFAINIAGRTRWDEDEAMLRAGYARRFAALDLALDAADPVDLVLFPEMDAAAAVPEITTACWDLLGVDPGAMMCATSRMVVKRKGAERLAVLACTLLPYDRRFELGHDLAGARGAVKLNHPHCAKFCVLGGGSCSKG